MISNENGLTETEEVCMNSLIYAWNTWLTLGRTQEETLVFNAAINECQTLISNKVDITKYPKYYVQKI